MLSALGNLFFGLKQSPNKTTMITDVNNKKPDGTIAFKIDQFSEFSLKPEGFRRNSETVEIKGIPWRISAEVTQTEDGKRHMGVYLWCVKKGEDDEWNCYASASMKITAQKEALKDYEKDFGEDIFFTEASYGWGYIKYVSFKKVMDVKNGWYDKEMDTVTLFADVNVKFDSDMSGLKVNSLKRATNLLANRSQRLRAELKKEKEKRLDGEEKLKEIQAKVQKMEAKVQETDQMKKQMEEMRKILNELAMAAIEAEEENFGMVKV